MKPFLRLSTTLAVFATGGVVAAACGSSAGPALGITYTDIYVDPSSFRGGVACGEGVGTMRSYVVTLFDVTPLVGGSGGNGSSGSSGNGSSGNGSSGSGSGGNGGGGSGGNSGGNGGGGSGGILPVAPLTCGASSSPPGFQLPSSPPTACTLRSLTGNVVPGNAYVAAIDAYPLPPCDAATTSSCLRPLAFGSPIMIDDAGNRVTPLGATCCGTAEASPTANGAMTDPDAGVVGLTNGPTVAIAVTQVPLRGCVPLGAVPTSHSVVVKTASLVGALGCATSGGSGAVAHLAISAGTNGDHDVPCGADLTLDGAPGAELAISVYAFSAQAAAPTWGTTCYATPVLGAIVEAACDPLATTGTVRIGSAVALSALGTTCAAGVATLVATYGGSASVTAACGAPISIPTLLPGVRTVHVEARDASGAVLKTTTCSANVTPGHFADATCTGGV